MVTAAHTPSEELLCPDSWESRVASVHFSPQSVHSWSTTNNCDSLAAMLMWFTCTFQCRCMENCSVKLDETVCLYIQYLHLYSVSFRTLTVVVLPQRAVHHGTLPMQWRVPTTTEVTVGRPRPSTCLAGAVARLTAPPAGVTEGLRWTLFNTGFS